MSSPASVSSRQSTACASVRKNQIQEFKVPDIPSGKTKKKTVLDEEVYIEEMGKIIERDFFPDLEKLRAQHAYIDAVEKNDVAKLRELYAKYSHGRPHTDRAKSPASFETPRHNTVESDTERDTNSQKENGVQTMRLDHYLNTHTSEDNESFEELMRDNDKKHRLKYAHLYREEEESDIREQNMLTLESGSKRPLALDTWGYKNKNAVMYVPDGVPLTQTELIELADKKQSIHHENTRLKTNPFNEQRSKQTIVELAKSQAKILDGRVGVDGKELTQTATPRVAGFSLLREPSPSPSLLGAASPLMTWGEIEGTPFRLDGGDTPLPRSAGPSFHINAPQKRERLALELAEKVGERHRDRKQKAIDAARRQLASPSPSTSRRLATMSPAARRLASTAKLYSTYTPTPKRVGTPCTPKRGTPSVVRTPKCDKLTDNLLKINIGRARASDFF